MSDSVVDRMSSRMCAVVLFEEPRSKIEDGAFQPAVGRRVDPVGLGVVLVEHRGLKGHQPLSSDISPRRNGSSNRPRTCSVNAGDEGLPPRREGGLASFLPAQRLEVAAHLVERVLVRRHLVDVRQVEPQFGHVPVRQPDVELQVPVDRWPWDRPGGREVDDLQFGIVRANRVQRAVQCPPLARTGSSRRPDRPVATVAAIVSSILASARHIVLRLRPEPRVAVGLRRRSDRRCGSACPGSRASRFAFLGDPLPAVPAIAEPVQVEAAALPLRSDGFPRRLPPLPRKSRPAPESAANGSYPVPLDVVEHAVTALVHLVDGVLEDRDRLGVLEQAGQRLRVVAAASASGSRWPGRPAPAPGPGCSARWSADVVRRPRGPSSAAATSSRARKASCGAAAAVAAVLGRCRARSGRAPRPACRRASA